MSDRIEINFTANVREVMRGTDQISDSLKGTERDLAELGDQGEQSLDQITDAQKETEKGAQKLGDSVGGDLVGAFGKLDGTAAGAIDAIAGGLSGVATALVPAAGAALGVLATEGVGLVTDFIRDQQKEVDELKARYSSLYASAAADGRAFVDEAQIQSETLKIYTDPDTSRYDQAKEDARTLGLTVQEVIRAQSGDQAALNTVLERSGKLESDRLATIQEQERLTLGRTGPDLELTTATELVNRYTAISDIQKENARKAAEFLGSELERNEVIQRRNQLLAETPKEIPVKLTVDETALNNSINRRRDIQVTVKGYTRAGVQVI